MSVSFIKQYYFWSNIVLIANVWPNVELTFFYDLSPWEFVT